ncbi:MAG: hypothetical protein WAV41_05890 [Microgenomates group bacterium]
MNINGNVLLDTNIVQYLASAPTSLSFINMIVDLNKKGCTMSVSEYSIFELIRGARLKTETDLSNTFNIFKKYSVSIEVLYAAARLETLYRMENIQCDKISDGDKIIAATSILTNSTILTTNGRDFPWPYYQETDRDPVIFSEKNISKSILVSSFVPDQTYIFKRFSERV